MNYGGFAVELTDDVEATVPDRAGRPVAAKSFRGEEVSRFTGNANYFDEIEKAHRKRLQAILNDEVIVRTP